MGSGSQQRGRMQERRVDGAHLRGKPQFPSRVVCPLLGQSERASVSHGGRWEGRSQGQEEGSEEASAAPR